MPPSPGAAPRRTIPTPATSDATAVGPYRRGALAPLTGLRWVFACWIVLLHSQFAGVAHEFVRQLERQGGGAALAASALVVIDTLADAGYVTVSLFLALGGYSLAASSLDARDGRFRKAPRAFWLGRALRFLPLLALTQLVRVPQFLLTAHDRSAWDIAGSILAGVTGLHAWFPGWVWDLNDPSWTLSVMFAGWAVFPWVAPRIAALPTRRLVALLGASWGACLGAAAAFVVVRGDVSRALTQQDFWMSMLHAHPLTRLPEFFSGVALAVLHTRHADRVAPLRGWLVVGALAVVGLVSLMHERLLPYVVFHHGFLLPAFWALTVGLVEHGGRSADDALPGRVARAARAVVAPLTNRRIQRGGRASFSLYLLHAVPLAALFVVRNAVAGRPLLHAGRAIPPHPAEMFLALAYMVAIAWFAIRFHERVVGPVTEVLLRRAGLARAAAPRPSADVVALVPPAQPSAPAVREPPRSVA